MGKLAKLKNLTYVNGLTIKNISFINQNNNLIKISPILFGIFSGKKYEQGTWQSLRQDNFVISKTLEIEGYNTFRVIDNSGTFIKITNYMILSLFLNSAEKETIKFLNNENHFLNKKENEWIVNIDKKKRITKFVKQFGINLSKKVYAFKKENLSFNPEPIPPKFILKNDSTIYQSNGKGRSIIVRSIDEIPAGMYVIIKTNNSIHVYIKMSNNKLPTI